MGEGKGGGGRDMNELLLIAVIILRRKKGFADGRRIVFKFSSAGVRNETLIYCFV